MTCDRCGARAKWRFRHPDNPLLELTFCGHHGGAHGDRLRRAGWFTYRLAKEPARV